MITAASTANLAIILVDARKGILTQTRRHSKLVSLVGIPHLVVAINKMDLVDYSQARFDEIRADYLAFAQKLGIEDVRFIPLSALNGDMIVERGAALSWYRGPTLLEILESAPAAHSEHAEKFRFPVQYVCRPQDSANPELHDYRGFMGQVESGHVRVGDAVTVLPGGQQSTVKAIQIGGVDIGAASTEQSVTLLLADEIDCSRGDMIVKSAEAPAPVKEIRATLCWLAETPLDRARTYLIRHTTRETKAKLTAIDYRLDVNTLENLPAEKLSMNDIAEVSFKLAQPLFTDPYGENRASGAFIVIDESSNNTVGAGMIS
jgi:sulfate adenylyltransferase subunit 1